jgi:hypothetical protein
LIKSAKRVLHFAPHHSVRLQLLTYRPQSRKAHLFSPQVREYVKIILFFVGPDVLDLAQNGRIILRQETPAVMPCGDCASVMARKSEISTYLMI